MAEKTTDIDIHGLGFTGEGYHRTGSSQFVSVPHTLPGDVVRVVVGQFRRGRAWARVVEHLHRSPDHIDPQCSAYDRCTGCALRHVDREYEKEWKLAAVRQILERYGPKGSESTPLDWIGEPQRDNHRIRGRFRLGFREDGVDIGFGGIVAPTEITDIRTCPAHSEPLRQLVKRVGLAFDGCAEVPKETETIELWAGLGEGANLLAVSLSAPVSNTLFEQRLATAVSGPILCIDPSGEIHPIAGQPHFPFTQTVGAGPENNPIRVWVPYGSWLPTNPTVSRHMVNWIRAQLPDHCSHLYDLCCGIGTITFGLAPYFRSITAIDEDRRAVAAVKEASERAQLGHIDVRAGRVGTVLRKLRRLPIGASGIVATINPMRRPLGGKQLRDLCALHVERIIYLGPSPVSAAKDGAVLVDMGYRLERAAAIDLHPGTAKALLGLTFVRKEQV